MSLFCTSCCFGWTSTDDHEPLSRKDSIPNGVAVVEDRFRGLRVKDDSQSLRRTCPSTTRQTETAIHRTHPSSQTETTVSGRQLTGSALSTRPTLDGTQLKSYVLRKQTETAVHGTRLTSPTPSGQRETTVNGTRLRSSASSGQTEPTANRTRPTSLVSSWQSETAIHRTRPISERETRRVGDTALPANHFSTMSVTPTSADLAANSEIHLEKNRVRGAYSSAEQYLNTQFRLLREDLISGLRKGVARIREDGGAADTKRFSDVKAIYRNLTIVSPMFGQTGLTFFVELDMNESLSKRICKGRTKNFITGSLLCLTADAFRTSFLFAVVAQCDHRRLNSKQGFEISFLPDSFAKYREMDNRTGPFLAVESEAYLEAYSHVLKGLQTMYSDGLPMKRYIAFCETNIRSVEGRDNFKVLDAQGEPVRKLRTLLSCAKESDDVSGELSLNDSQYRAYISALHQQLSIIQGPPGTGKTHVGLRIMRTLLYNLYDDGMWSYHSSEGPGPILVICYTNHALDQFLEGILKFSSTSDILRVGGGSKNERMKKCTFYEHREKTPSSFKKSYWKLSQLKEECQNKHRDAMFDVSSANSRILPYDTPGLVGDGRAYKQFCIWHREENPQGSKTHVNVMAVWLCCDAHSFSMLNPDHSEPQRPALETIEVKTEADEERERRFIDDGEELDDNSPRDVEAEFEVKLTDKQKRQLQQKIKTELAGKDVMTADEVRWIDNFEGSNIRDLSLEKRWKLYRYWIRKFKSKREQDVLDDGEDYQGIVDELTQLKVKMNAGVMAACKVVGMTTTGAAKYRESLHIVGPKIVIAEEAAEVLEAHITTALTCHCEQLILIGDHKQLRPNPTVHDLVVDYHLDLSMFERFVNNGLPHITLNKQHRMRPEISVFVRNVYGRLDDHESVHGREPIRGVASSVTFFNHHNPETAEGDTTSKSNMFEVEMVVGLVRFLVQQDYEPKDITVITMYTKQMFELKSRLPRNTYEDLRVKSVDDFQGEESKIVILSLVRSNSKGITGFVSVDNRVCVALSRARDGMFVFGNFNLFKRKSKLWAKIVADAENSGVLVDSIKVTCSHRPQPALIKKPEDFEIKAPDGGCTKNCGEKLACGHTCRLKCHYSHLNYQCLKRCGRRYANCSHHCKLLCYEKCQPCQVSVQVKLPCGHLQRVACHVSTGDLTDIDCAVDCVDTLECGHKCRNKCSQPCTDKCVELVEQICRRCGKENTVPCHLARRYKYLGTYGGKFTCNQKCGSMMDCGHRCTGLCNDCHGETTRHQQCQQTCDKKLVCGHRCGSQCSSCTLRGKCQPCRLLCAEYSRESNLQ